MKFTIMEGDITQVAAGAIVNAANSSLAGGGGVDGAIHRAAGPRLDEACREIRTRIHMLPAGEAVLTEGFNLKSPYIIHTVGPVWHGGSHQEADTLAACYRNVLTVAIEHRIRTIAFPNISTGVYGFPKDKAAAIAHDTLLSLGNLGENFDEIIFVCFDRENFSLYSRYFS